MSDTSKRAWLKPFLAPIRPIFREVLAMSAFVNMMALAVPVFTMQVYDRVIGHAGLATLVGFIIGMFIVLIFDYVLRVSRSRIMQTVALRIDVLVGHRLFNKLMELPLQELEGRPASYWQALFRDVDTVRNTVSGASALLACDLPFFFLFFTVIALVARFLIGKELQPFRFRAVGFADTQPKVPNRDAKGEPIKENQATNRRIQMRLERMNLKEQQRCNESANLKDMLKKVGGKKGAAPQTGQPAPPAAPAKTTAQ